MNAARWIFVLFGGLGLAYSLVVPAFETPDEPFHYAFARHVAQGQGLPVQEPTAPGPWAQEGSQAPLYYLIAGAATAAIDQSDFAALAVENPRANIGDPLTPGNKNFMLTSGQWRPLTGSNLALHVGRWISLLLGAATLWGIYRLACFALPAPLPLAALALAATIPQFVFLSASFSNDNAVIAASTLTLVWLARLLTKAPDARIQRWEWGVLGTALGLAALSKLQGLGLLPLSGLVILWIAWQRRQKPILVQAVVWVGIPALLIAGWWYGRNLALYGDWSGLAHLMEMNGRRQEPLSWQAFWPEFAGLRYSAWGLFGWFNLLLPSWFYGWMDLITLVGLGGAAIATLQRLRPVLRDRAQLRSISPTTQVLLLCWLWLAMMALLLLFWTLQATGSQGRLLFPALAPFTLLLVWGLHSGLQRLAAPLQRLAWLLLPTLLAAMSLYALLWLLPTAYYPPPPVAAVDAEATPLDLRYGQNQSLRLLGVRLATSRLRAGTPLPVTLYLRTDRPLENNYQLFMQLLDENNQEIANLTTHPGWGRRPTRQWKAGAIYADSYELAIDRPVAAGAPLAARLYVGFIDPQTEAAKTYLPLPAYTAGGEELTPLIGTVVIEPARSSALAGRAVGSEFGAVIRLASQATTLITATATLSVTLDWEAIGTPATDYTAFVHVLDANGQRVAGDDRAPAGERFPTRYWRAGDRIQSQFAVVLGETAPPTARPYSVWVGLYESVSAGSVRLPVTAAAGLPAGDGQVQITTVEPSPAGR